MERVGLRRWRSAVIRGILFNGSPDLLTKAKRRPQGDQALIAPPVKTRDSGAPLGLCLVGLHDAPTNTNVMLSSRGHSNPPTVSACHVCFIIIFFHR